MANSPEKELVKTKLDFLEGQKQQLFSLIHNKIDKVVTNGQAWLSYSSEEDTASSFTGIYQKVVDTITFVSLIVKEFEGSSDEETQAEASVKLSVASSSDSSSSSVDKKEMKSLRSWMKKMEDAIKTLTTPQTSLGNVVAALSAKQSNTEDKWMKQFNQVTEKVTDLDKKADEFVQQNNRNIHTLEEELQTMRISQDELKKGMAARIESKERWQAELDSLQQDMGTVQVDVQKLRAAIQEQGEAIHTSKDDATKLKKITDELSSLSLRKQSLESKCARPVVGFTASAQNYCPTVGANVQWDKDSVKCNTDKSFNVGTGIFTAPVKGIYFIGLNLWEWNDGHIGLKVWLTRKSSTNGGDSERRGLFSTYTNKACSSETGMTVIDMDAGDTVHVEVYEKGGDVYLEHATQLTCFLTG